MKYVSLLKLFSLCVMLSAGLSTSLRTRNMNSNHDVRCEFTLDSENK